MRKSNAVLAAALAIAPAFPAFAAESDMVAMQAVAAKAGQMVYSTAGRPLLPVYKVTAGGEPQVIVDSRVLTLPAATLSMSGQKLTTSLSLTDLRRMSRP